jgi:CheY-like chemotaxis protein
MKKQYKTLFIDDELFFAQPYVDELGKFSTVAIRTSASEAVDEFQKATDDYICSVLDVMLPPPKGWEVKTKEGLDTGIEVLRRCRDNIIKAKLPVVVLTQRQWAYVKDEVAIMNFPAGLVEIHSKTETRPFFLATIVKRLVRQWKKANLP